MARRAVNGLAIATFMLASCAGGVGTGAPPRGVLPVGSSVGDVELSPFYRFAGTMPPRPGTVLREEALPAALVPAHAGTARRILYSSVDGRWNSGALPASGALFLPQARRRPVAGR